VTTRQTLRLKLQSAPLDGRGGRVSHPWNMPQSGKHVSIPTKLLATGLACAVTLVVCATAATIIASSELAAKPEQAVIALSPRDIEGDFFRDAGPTAALIDSLLAPLGAARDANAEDVALMMALVAGHAPIRGAWDVRGSAALVTRVPRAPARILPVRAALDSLSASEFVAAMSDTGSAWMPVYRRWARSRPLPALWGYRRGLTGVQTVSELPARNFDALRALFSVNDNVALVALRAGDDRGALTHARENLSASRHFLEQPTLNDALMGRHFARRAAQLMAIAATHGGDDIVLHQALRLDSASSRFDLRVIKWLYQQQANPHAVSAVEVAADRALPPAIRVGAMMPIVTAGCRDTREIVFGFSHARPDVLQRAARAVADIERAGELADLYRRQLDDIRVDPERHAVALPVKQSIELAGLGALEWMVPPGVRARIALCTAWGY
jgi:hypothetical protein